MVGTEAPREVSVHREEIHRAIHTAKPAAPSNVTVTEGSAVEKPKE